MARRLVLTALVLMAASVGAAQSEVTLDGYGAVKEGAMIGPDRQYVDGFTPPVHHPDDEIAPDAEAGDYPHVTKEEILVVDVLVGTDGQVVQTVVVNTGVDSVWTARVLDTICRWKFIQPGMLDGQPVAVWLKRHAWRFLP